MSNNVDDRVVAMKFDNGAFESGAKTTMSTLDKLKAALNFSSSTKSVQDLQASTDKFDMGHMGTTIEGVSGKFLAMATVGVTALSNIVNRAVDAGLSLAKSLTISPITDGLHEYETQLNSIQTILANTSASGATLDDVNAALDELNTYSDKTIYNFSEMAKNIGTFTAAGVDLKTSTESIKGIANLAAISGSNSDQASTAMYQLSQAIATGKVSLMDWNSVVNAGMGGKTFQTALYNTAQAMGTINKNGKKQSFEQWTDAGNSFRDSLQDGWITADVLTNTLSTFTGDLTDAQLKAIGFNDEQIAQIKIMGQMGQDAATKVKTLSQLVGTVKEAVGSGWTQTWQLIFGDFGEARDTFTNLSNVIGGAVSRSADARNKILSDWKALGGRTMVIDTIAQAFKILGSLLEPLRQGFRDVFPAMTGERLFDLTKKVHDFIISIKPSGELLTKLYSIFSGLFAAIDIGRRVLMGIAGVFAHLFGVLVQGSGGGILDFLVKVGDWFYHLDGVIINGNGLVYFFDRVNHAIDVAAAAFGVAKSAVSAFFHGFDSEAMDGVEESFGRVNDRLKTFNGLGDKLVEVWSHVAPIFDAIGHALEPVVEKISSAFSTLGHAISDAIATGNFNEVTDTLNTVLFAGMLVLFKKFMKNGILGNGGMVSSIEKAFHSLTGTMKAMQTDLKADALQKIAIAIGILTLSVVALSLIDSDRLTSALTAMGIGFGQLLAAMAILTKATSTVGFIKIPAIAASMILLATAVTLLVGAVALLGTMDIDTMQKGLTAVGILLLELSVATKLMSTASPTMILTSLGLIAVAVAVNILALAVRQFADMSWEEMGKGLAGVAGGLLIIAGAMQLMPATLPITAAGLILVGVALLIISKAVSSFAAMDWQTMGRGIAGIAGGLLIIAGAMQLMPATLPITALGLILVGEALLIIDKAVKSMAEMSWKEIVRGLTAMAGALLIIAIGLNIMNGTLAGSAALLIAAGALAILAPVLKILGGLSWLEIAKGLVAIAGAFAVLGIAGLLLAPIIVPILAVAAALLIVGTGLALVGVGTLALATAFALLATVGTAGVGVVTAMLSAIIDLIPQALSAFAKGLIQFAVIIGEGGPAFAAAFVAILNSLLDAVIVVTPKLLIALTVLLQAIFKLVQDNVPGLVETGYSILLALLHGIDNNIGEIVDTVASIIVNFLEALARNLDKIIQAGVDLIIAFIEGLAKAIQDNSARLAEAGVDLATAIVEGILKGLAAGAKRVIQKVKDMAGDALDAAKDFLHINSPSKKFMEVGSSVGEGFALGIDNSTKFSNRSVEDMAKTALQNVKDSIKNIGNVLDGQANMNPVISPVLDLTHIKDNVNKIGQMFGNNKMVGYVSWEQASSIAASNQPTTDDGNDPSDPTAPTGGVLFQQNNYSPEALSTAEIYRRTNNQLSQAKELLKL